VAVRLYGFSRGRFDSLDSGCGAGRSSDQPVNGATHSLIAPGFIWHVWIEFVVRMAFSLHPFFLLATYGDAGYPDLDGSLKGEAIMLWTILVVLLVLWLIGAIANVGPLIHLLLVFALVIFLINLLTGRRTA
jgi:hypothetical protein